MLNLTKKSKKKKKRPHKEKWYDEECEIIRKQLRKLSNQKHREPQKAELRQKYHETLKQYKKTIYQKKKQHYNQNLQEIENSIKQNQFWENGTL